MENARFRIDYSGGSYEPFGLFYLRPGFFARWNKIYQFKTKDEARAFYELIKDLPEYLT